MAFKEQFEKIEKIEKTAKAAPMVEIPEEIQRVPPNKERFDNLMTVEKLDKTQPDIKIDTSTRSSSLFDEVHALSSKTENLKVTPTELIAQTEQAVNKMETIKNQLQTPGLELKDSTSTLMRNKLSHIDDNINIAVSKVGGEIQTTGAATSAPLTASNNPITRFLGMLTDGQYKLQGLAADVERMHLNKVDFNPATMLAMQIKVNYINQELEFFSSLLNKGLESTKTIMNVQV